VHRLLSIASLSIAAALLSGCPEPAGFEPAFDATEVGWLMNTWGFDRDGLLAVGGGPAAGVMLRYDGEWTREDLGVDVPLLNWIHGFGASDVTVVGNSGTVLHFDGTAWIQGDSGTTENLWGVWGATPDDLWAVGGSGFPDATAIVIHYDGTAWTTSELPVLERDVHGFFKVWGAAADDVYVVGQRGVVLHWDGAAWTELLVGANDDLVSIWGTAPDRIVAVGGRGNGIVARWDGTEWTSQFLTPLPGLNGVWTRDGQTIHVAGVRGTLGTLDFDTLEFTDMTANDLRDFHSLFGVGGRVTAVGGNLATGLAGPYRGIAYWRELSADE